MRHNRLRPLPVRVAPAHLEPAGPYISRALTSLGLNDRSTMLIRRYRREHAVSIEAATRAVAAVLAGEQQYWRGRARTPHEDGSSCFRCTVGPDRFACLRCTHGVPIRQVSHQSGQVCIRHRVWVGGTLADQKPVDKATAMADRVFRRLAERIDSGRLREIQRLLAAHSQLLGRQKSDADLYPTAIKLYRLLLDRGLLRLLLSRHLTFQAAYDVLDQHVAALIDEPSSITDGLWLLLRPAALSVYETLVYGQDRATFDAHDVRVPADLTHGSGEGVGRPVEPFKRYLAPLRTSAPDRVAQELRIRVHRTPRMAERIDLHAGMKAIAAMICESGHRLKSSPSHIAKALNRRTPGCAYCSHRRYPGESGIPQREPLLFAEFDTNANPGIDPEGLMSTDRVHWRCLRAGHTAFTRVDTRRELGCTACRRAAAVQVERPGFAGDPSSTFLIRFPERAAGFHSALNAGRTLEGIGHSSEEVLLWSCDNGHVWPTTANSIARGHGCCYCSNLYVWPGFNDLASTEPEVAAEWDYDENGAVHPTDVYRLRKKPYAWKCTSHGHTWTATVFDRVKRGRGCPYCGGTQTWAGFNCMETTDPETAAVLHPYLNAFTASEVSAGSQRRAFFNCGCGQIYNEKIAYVSRRKHKLCTDCQAARSEQLRLARAARRRENLAAAKAVAP